MEPVISKTTTTTTVTCIELEEEQIQELVIEALIARGALPQGGNIDCRWRNGQVSSLYITHSEKTTFGADD